MNRDSWVSLIDALLHWSQRSKSELPQNPTTNPKKVDWEVVPFDFNNVGGQVPAKARKAVKRKAAKKA